MKKKNPTHSYAKRNDPNFVRFIVFYFPFRFCVFFFLLAYVIRPEKFSPQHLFIEFIIIFFLSVFSLFARSRVCVYAQLAAGWICCVPCVWLRTSATMHKIAITTATLLVTSLLVASPVLFLLSTAPSQLPKECNSKTDLNCLSARVQAPECTTMVCHAVTLSIQSRTNWKIDPCNDYRAFSCSSARGSFKMIKSAQEEVDHLMQSNLIFGHFS